MGDTLFRGTGSIQPYMFEPSMTAEEADARLAIAMTQARR